MRRVKIFAGSSHPGLVDAICERLGTQPAKCDLRKFSNGETSVSIETSIRDQDVFIVQSGSPKVNDTVMELLIMVAACKGGSAKSITGLSLRINARYFPYSRQSKKKSHRGAIAAKLVANLLSVAGIDHVITVDLHAPPAQGFFGKPVDNLHAEPLIARWIRNHVSGWKEAVVVSKNPGGSKRVTSLADALKLNFGIITTDRRRMTMGGSSFLDTSGFLDRMGDATYEVNHLQRSEMQAEASLDPTIDIEQPRDSSILPNSRVNGATDRSPPLSSMPLRQVTGANPSPHARTVDAQQPQHVRTPIPRSVSLEDPISEQDSADEYTDQRATEVITGRLVQGHLVDDDDPSPILSTMSGSVATLPGDGVGPPQLDDQDPMTSSVMSHLST
ncbi:MAG: hypothetical protein Q9177_006435, partial [Variospora cf. flavescens]